MARGRKLTTNLNTSWESVFYNCVGFYVQCINNELSKEYKLEPLCNHIKIVGGYAFKTAEYIREGVPIIRISDFNNEQIVVDDVVYYKEAKELDRYELQESDIIIALTGGTIAKLAIVQPGLGKLYLNQRVGKFHVLQSELFEKEYIYWIARSVQNIIKNLAWGAAIPNVSPKQIENIQFPFPSKSTQQGIISFLNDLKSNSLSEKEYFNIDIEEKIIELHACQISGNAISSELSHQLSLIKQLRRAFLAEAMQGKLCQSEPTEDQETGEQLLERIKAEKAQLIKDKKLKKEKELPSIKPEEIPFEIPENWVWCRLGEICELITKGSSPNWQGVQYVEKNKGILFITSKNVDNFKLNLTKATYVHEEFNSIEPRSILRKGDLLTNIVGASIGRTAIFNLDCIANINQAVCILRLCNAHINKEYMLSLLNSDLLLQLMLESQFAPGRANLSMSNISSFPIPLPPLATQNQIVSKLDQLMKTCDELETSIKQSQLQNEQLLRQVLKEALEVREEEVV